MSLASLGSRSLCTICWLSCLAGTGSCADPTPLSDDEPSAPVERVRVGEGDAAPNAFCSPTSVAVGQAHTCELDSSGQLSCTGTILQEPVAPPSGTFRAVSSGDWQ